jgi:hypothetical protein
MRYRVGFLWACALSALLLVGCGAEALCEGVECEDDGNECTNGVCVPATGTCQHTTVEDDTACDFDGLPGLCKAGVCVDAMLCQGVECEDDGNECTNDVCDPATGTCDHTPVEDGTPCADGRGGCYDGLCNFRPVSVTVGDKELVFDWTTDRCEGPGLDVPDQPARFVRAADGELVLFDGNAPTYYVSRGADFDSLARVCDPPALVSADLRTPESYENWEWLWSIYREGSDWHALIHNEFHDTVAATCKVGDPSPGNPCWHNSLTYAVSTDGAQSFVKPGAPTHVVAPAPSAWSPPLPGTPPWFRDFYYLEGYVNPSNIILGPEDYYYAIIPALLGEGRAEGACAIRTRTLSDPASWRAWDGNGFNLALESPYQTGGEAPTCEFLPAPEDEAAVVSSFSLTYNTYLGRYMLVTEWGDPSDPSDLRCGIYFSLSTDLVHWSEFQEITPARVGDDHSLRRCPPGGTTPGELEPVRVQYASIIDHEDSSINFERPGRTPYLYYTRHNDGGGDRDLLRVPVRFTLSGALCDGVECDDQNACTEDVCNGADGTCEYVTVENGTLCAEGLCIAGECRPIGSCESAKDCDDDNECIEDACNPSDGLCENTPVEDGTACADEAGSCRTGLCREPELVLTGEQEVVIGNGQWGLYHTPDGHISYYRTDNAYQIWLTSTGGAHHFTSSDFDELIPANIEAGKSIPAFTESGEGFDRDYAGPGSVVRASNGKDLLMFYHGEYQWDEGGYYATIGLARSSDEGQTWERLGAIIAGRLPKPDPPPWPGAFGAGGPCALVDEGDGFIYIYYLDWGAPLFPESDIHLARSPISSDGAPGSWQKYFRGKFDEPGIDGNSEPVIRGPSSTGFWAGFPSVSFNVFLDAYLAVFVSADGFYYSTSWDRINWTVGKKLLTRNETPDRGEPWHLYPSLLSPSQPTDSTTDETGYLYYGYGIYNVTPHYMVRRAVKVGWPPVAAN